MTAGDLIYQLGCRGVTLFVGGGRLRFRAPAGAYTAALRAAVAERRAELLALLAWDEAAVARELQAALRAIDATEAATWPTPAQRNVLSVMRSQVQAYHARRDTLLSGAAGWVQAHVARWLAGNEQEIRGADRR